MSTDRDNDDRDSHDAFNSPTSSEQAFLFILNFLRSFTSVHIVTDTPESQTYEFTELSNARITLRCQPYGTSIHHVTQGNKVQAPYAYKWRCGDKRQRAQSTRRIKSWLLRKLDLLAKRRVDNFPDEVYKLRHLLIRPLAFNPDTETQG
jgi:hypothetical protein